MSGSHVFVLLIIILAFSYALIRSWMGNRRDGNSVSGAEAEEMLARIDALEDRIRVLERIVTENRVDLKQQIDSLQ